MPLTRRSFVQLGAAAAMQRPARAAAVSRPNILFLLTDQQRFDCTGIYGNTAIHTPNIDRIGREGAVFRSAYSSTPTCTPARSALLTGLSPWHHGMLGMTNMAQSYPLEKPRALRDAGYYTATVGKQHFTPMRNGHGYHRMILDEHCACGNVHDTEAMARRAMEDRSDYEAWFYSQAPTLDPHATGLGWNDYPAKAFALPERLHATRWTGDTAVNFLNDYRRPEPFFLKVSFIRPHSPYDPPERFMRMYAEAELPAARAGKWAARYEQRNSARDDIWRGKLRPDEIRRSRQGYYGSISHVDEQIGRILESLEKRGWLDETLIVFTSDHGDMTGDHNLWRKSYPYEPSAHIPMMMRWPTGLLSAARGQTLAQPVELRDILPTFMETASAPLNRQIGRRSLLSVVPPRRAGWGEMHQSQPNNRYNPEKSWKPPPDRRTKYIFHA